MIGGWIGVDLDGTLAHYDEWKGPDHIGAPIKPMVDRVRAWLDDGKHVKIFTARVCGQDRGHVAEVIKRWCAEHIGQELEVTCVKDYGMVELWDDRAVQVVPNAGVRADGVAE